MDASLNQLIGADAQPFVIFDLEWTAWEGSQARGWSGPGEYREVVQIGAIGVDPRTGFSELAAYSRLVRPQKNPALSRYFEELTGVTQRDIEECGVLFPKALAEFASFVSRWSGRAASFGIDAVILRENCDLASCDFPFRNDVLIDIRTAVISAMGADHASTMSSDLAVLAGAGRTGRAHDAVSDCRSIAVALSHIAANIT